MTVKNEQRKGDMYGQSFKPQSKNLVSSYQLGMVHAPALPLSAPQKQGRLIGILLILGFLTYAFFLNPDWRSPSWAFPDFLNVIGIPCLFCGGTRATHFILHGDFQRALYFNWIAFPAVVAAVSLVLIMSIEVGRRRVLLPTVRLHRSQWVVLGTMAAFLWGHHVYDALYSPKPELLNREGLFFRFSSSTTQGEISK